MGYGLRADGLSEDDVESLWWERLAYEWKRRAAEQGDNLEQYLLGDSYAYGCNVSQDDAEAVRWYRLAAAQGDWMGRQALQEMYVEGRVVSLHELELALWNFVVSESDRCASERLEPIPPPPLPPPQ
jgi:TPR repeat protein